MIDLARWAATLSHGLARATEPAATLFPVRRSVPDSEWPQRAAQDHEGDQGMANIGLHRRDFLGQGLTTAAAMVGGVALGRSDELPAIDIHKL